VINVTSAVLLGYNQCYCFKVYNYIWNIIIPVSHTHNIPNLIRKLQKLKFENYGPNIPLA
jgi:hypothetical protein